MAAVYAGLLAAGLVAAAAVYYVLVHEVPLPGFGFSGPVPDPGWTIPRATAAMSVLMAELGYDRYVARAVTSAPGSPTCCAPWTSVWSVRA